MAKSEYHTLKEFWPFYLSEHAHPINRLLHFVGSALTLLAAGYILYKGQFVYLLSLPVIGYGFAWVGHFLIEKNRPATFTYPVKSFVCDWIMFFYILTGQINNQLQKHKISNKK